MKDAWMTAQYHVGDAPLQFITVREWPDAPDCVEVCTERCEDFFGRQSIVMSPQLARKLAEALVHLADHIESQNGGGHAA